MPIYEYKCNGCQAEFELLVRGSEQAACPTCQGEHLEKRWSVPASPATSNKLLPVCPPPSPSGCGRPQCGMGGCQFD